MRDACIQTEDSGEQQQQPEWADPLLLEAARLEIERLQAVNATLLESQAQGGWFCIPLVTWFQASRMLQLSLGRLLALPYCSSLSNATGFQHSM